MPHRDTLDVSGAVHSRLLLPPALLRTLGYAAVAAAILVQIGVAAAAWSGTRLNWDLVAYVGLVLERQGVPASDIHPRAYQDVRDFADRHGQQARYADMAGDSPYRRAMATDADAYRDNLPFYRIRPLYVAAIGVLAHLTGSITAAVVSLSVGASFVAGLLVLSFAVACLGPLGGAAAGIVFALAPPLTLIAIQGTPDTVAVCAMAAGCILLVQDRAFVGALVLLAAVAVRTDMAVFDCSLAASLCLIAAFTRSWRPLLLPILILVCSAPLMKGIEAWAGNYGYGVLYHFTFLATDATRPSTLAGLPIPPVVFVRTALQGVRESLSNGSLWILLSVLATAAITFARATAPARPIREARPPAWTACLALILAVGAATAARAVLFPSHDPRQVGPAITAATIALLAAAALHRPPPALS